MADKNTIENTWIPLARPVEQQSNGTASLTDDDLDAIASNFQPELESDHIPVRFGSAKGDGPVVAKIGALRHSKDGLEGKLANVDPRFDLLYQAKKLGARNQRSIALVRSPDSGPTMTAYGFDAPRSWQGGEWPVASGKTLDELVKKHQAGEEVQFNANDSGRLNIVFTEPQPPRENSQRLHDLAVKRSGDRNISYCDALSQVARERPELTQPQSMRSNARAPEAVGFRFQTNDEALAEKAKARADEKDISYAEALSQVVCEHPEITLPGNFFSSSEEPQRPLRRSERLNDLAKARQRERSISFGEALSQVAAKHPELTLPDHCPLESEGS